MLGVKCETFELLDKKKIMIHQSKFWIYCEVSWWGVVENLGFYSFTRENYRWQNTEFCVTEEMNCSNSLLFALLLPLKPNSYALKEPLSAIYWAADNTVSSILNFPCGPIRFLSKHCTESLRTFVAPYYTGSNYIRPTCTALDNVQLLRVFC
jgi:hypothetical protein